MRLAIATFIIVSLIIILLSLLSLPVWVLTVDPGLLTEGVDGGPLDTSPMGTSIAYALIQAMGYTIVGSPEEADGIVLLNPALCDPHTAVLLERDIQSLGSDRPFLVVAASPQCIYTMSYVGVEGRLVRLQEPTWALGLNGEMWPTLYSLRLDMVESPYSIVAYTVRPAGVAAIAVEKPDRTIVVYADGEAFTNRVVSMFVQAGVSPEPMLALLLESAGADPGARIYVPSYVYGEPASDLAQGLLSIPIGVRGFVADLIEALADFQRSLAEGVSGDIEESLLVVALFALPSGWLASKLLVDKRAGVVRNEVVEPPRKVEALTITRSFEMIRRATRKGRLELGPVEARNLIRALYYLTDAALRRAYGTSLQEAFGFRRVRSLTGDPHIDWALRRLYVVYMRKVEGRSWFPLFVRVEKEAVRLYETLIPFLERLGVRLSGPRGLEYERGRAG